MVLAHPSRANQEPDPTMPLRTISLVTDDRTPLSAYLTRQWPGTWPRGDSIVGNSIFIPPIGGQHRGDWLVCPSSPPPERISTDIPRERRILFVVEPPEFWQPPVELLDSFGYVVSPYPLPQFQGVQIPSVTTGLLWWYGIDLDGHRPTGNFMTLDAIRREPWPEKTRLMSVITSAKAFLPGHRKRLAFVQQLKEAFGDALDLYGAGINPIADKREALAPYLYHVAIENAVHPHFWTEKLADPMLGRCVTFYHGAPSAAASFPEGVVVPIDIDRPQAAIDTIVAKLRGPLPDRPVIEAARNRLIDFYNFPSFCDHLIDAIEAQENEQPARYASAAHA
jgi:hypothetical protein